MRLSTTLRLESDPRDCVAEVVALERAGVDTLFVPEAYGFDAPTTLGYLAAHTTSMRLGPGILPLYSRSPALIAQTAAGLDAVSGGRAVLGLGASGPQVVEGWHGVPYDRPLARTREIIDICRRVWRRERLTNDGLYPLPLPADQGTGLGKPIALLNHPVRERIPVFVAALGERNVELTAEIAEGWLPLFFQPEHAQRIWRRALDTGRVKRDPSLGDLEVVAGGLLAIGDDVEGAVDLARPTVALYVGGMGARGRNFYNDLACRYGYEDEAGRIQDLYLDGRKREAEAAVPEELIRLTNLVGPPGWVAERVAAYREAGVTTLHVSPVGPDPLGSVARLKEMVT